VIFWLNETFTKSFQLISQSFTVSCAIIHSKILRGIVRKMQRQWNWVKCTKCSYDRSKWNQNTNETKMPPIALLKHLKYSALKRNSDKIVYTDFDDKLFQEIFHLHSLDESGRRRSSGETALRAYFITLRPTILDLQSAHQTPGTHQQCQHRHYWLQASTPHKPRS